MATILAAAAVWVVAGARLPAWRTGWLPTVPWSQLRLAAGVAVASGVLAFGVTAVPAISAAVGLMFAAIPVTIGHAKRSRERAALAAALPDFLVRLRGHLAGGDAIPEAFLAAARASGGRLAGSATAVEACLARGGTFQTALQEAREMLDDPLTDRVLTVLSAAHTIGGRRVAAILAALGASVADELRLREAHDAALTQQRLTALVALVAPWVLLIITAATNPTAAAAYRSPGGTAVVATGLIATAVGYLLTRHAARLRRPPRLFR